MSLRFVAVLLVALVLPLSAGAAAGPVVVFRATTHTPKVNANWPWSITVTKGGKPLAGTVTAQVIDPIGGVHAVEFGGVKNRFVTNVKLKGRFSDFVIYPAISQGVRVTFRVTVKTAVGKRVVNYWVQAR
jgi:hypothetical protein